MDFNVCTVILIVHEEAKRVSTIYLNTEAEPFPTQSQHVPAFLNKSSKERRFTKDQSCSYRP